MSRPLVPRTTPTASPTDLTQQIQRPRKISTACGACKQRKTRCSGTHPCDACATRNSQCIYDATSDQRRKIANQRNVQDLAETQSELEKCRQLLGGIIATVRVGSAQSTQDLIGLIRIPMDLSQLAAHVRNECRSNLEIQNAYNSINFVINGDDELPSPSQILSRGQGSVDSGLTANLQMSDPGLSLYGGDFSMYDIHDAHHE